MKYDPDIALEILRKVEEWPSDELPMQTVLLSNIDEESYYFHCRLLGQAGYMTVYEVRLMSRNFYWPRQINWDGVQFLELFRNEPLWQRVKQEAIDTGAGMSLNILFQIGKKLVGQAIGLDL